MQSLSGKHNFVLVWDFLILAQEIAGNVLLENRLLAEVQDAERSRNASPSIGG